MLREENVRQAENLYLLQISSDFGPVRREGAVWDCSRRARVDRQWEKGEYKRPGRGDGSRS